MSDRRFASDHSWNQSVWEKVDHVRRGICMFLAQGAARGAKCSPLEMRERGSLMCNNYNKGVCALLYIRSSVYLHTYPPAERAIIPKSETRVLCSVCGARSLWKSLILSLAQSCAEFEYKRVANKVHVSSCHWFWSRRRNKSARAEWKSNNISRCGVCVSKKRGGTR